MVKASFGSEWGANAIADRALREVGTPFRLHGRQSGIALDCVGLVAVAVGPYITGLPVPTGYRFRGHYTNRVTEFFGSLPFENVELSISFVPGDILLAEPCPGQLHFAVHSNTGWVHAHAGLKRVICAPLSSEIRPLLRWRLIGE